MESNFIPKSGWAVGPWTNEPDGAFVNISGIPCFVIRDMQTGCFNSYFGVPVDKKFDDLETTNLHGKPFYQRCGDEFKLDVLFKLTSSIDVIEMSKIDTRNYHWIGFSYCSEYDFSPGIAANADYSPLVRKLYDKLLEHLEETKIEQTYKDLEFVKKELLEICRRIFKARAKYDDTDESGIH